MPQKLTLTEQLRRAEIGQVFYTDTKDTVVGSYAARAGVKVTTERIIAIHPGKRELIDLTRVTVLHRDDEDDEPAPTTTVVVTRRRRAE